MNKILVPINILLKAIGANDDSKGLVIIGFIVAIIAVLIIPLPAMMLDFLLGTSIALSVLIIIIALYIQKVTDFSSFPTILLFVTLFRLSLNVATTRMILSNGHLGPDAVSDIVTAFGNFVVGGNYVIGIIVFTILVIVNLLVITNGSTRVTEVRARFALDSMQGRQMAIEADLNAQYITEDEANKRRANLTQELDFYGSMDGASKFIKGDAIASIIITIVNIAGGFLIGVFQNDLSASQAASTYTILTIGDGLVSQIPALIIATATGIVATRTSSIIQGAKSYGAGAIKELFVDTRPLFIVGFILLMFAIVPGLPTFSLGFIGLLFIYVGWVIGREDQGSVISQLRRFIYSKTRDVPKDVIKDEATQEGKTDYSHHKAQPKPVKTEEELSKEADEKISSALATNDLEVFLGYELALKIVDPKLPDNILNQIRSLRHKIAETYGFVIPRIYLKDNIKSLQTNEYKIVFQGIEMGRGTLMIGKWMCVPQGDYVPEGIKTKDNAFGIDVVWIDQQQKDEANIHGLICSSPTSVLAIHIEKVIKEIASELLTRDEIDKLIARLSQTHPTIFKESANLSKATIRDVLKALLKEGVPIKNLAGILETMLDCNTFSMNFVDTLAQVRIYLKRTITNLFQDEDGILKFFMLDAATNAFLMQNMIKTVDKTTNIERSSFVLNREDELLLIEEISKLNETTLEPLLCVEDQTLRYMLAEKFMRHQKAIDVICIYEIDERVRYEILGEISIDFNKEHQQ